MAILNKRIRERWQKSKRTSKKPDSTTDCYYQHSTAPSTSGTPACVTSKKVISPKFGTAEDAVSGSEMPSPELVAIEDIASSKQSTPKQKNRYNFDKWLDRRQHEMKVESQSEPFIFHDCETGSDSAMSQSYCIHDHYVSASTDETYDPSGDMFDQLRNLKE